MKRFTSILVISILLLCSGCIQYQGERPFDYPPARWVSETPDIWFDVYSPYTDATETTLMDGQLTLPEQTIPLIIGFDYTDKIYITTEKYTSGLSGSCAFSSDKLIVTVDKESDTLLNGCYDTLVFVRTSLPDTQETENLQEAETEPTDDNRDQTDT